MPLIRTLSGMLRFFVNIALESLYTVSIVLLFPAIFIDFKCKKKLFGKMLL